ncbi:MAG: FtsW/RodA/SpoVE family cell cycle protein [Candidatus Brennerbacteria bacterium]|nr:FtsW/RodA/SpoVE family cell cycle protein [Candidatus Brennerbacteria bacterium]
MISYFRGFDWVLLGGIAVLAAASLLSLYSLDITLFSRQVVWWSLAAIVIVGGSRLDWRGIIGQDYFRKGLYWLSVLLLVVVNLQSETIRGVKSWLAFGSLEFQPAELSKLALILLLAGFFSRRYVAAWLGKNIALSFFYAALPAALVAVQPDLGSAAVIVAIWVGFLLTSGVNKKRLLVGLVIAVLVGALLWVFFLKPYQRERVVGFLNPSSDQLGINYNVVQSKIAIGSAGLWGKGFGSGSQTQLGFLPEAGTDFLFAAFVEEWGIFGGLVVVLAFLLILYRITRIGMRAGNNDSKFIVLGLALVLAVQFFLNIGSNLGLLPITGINFPFLSYGGSSLLTLSVLVSIIQKIKIESR